MKRMCKGCLPFIFFSHGAGFSVNPRSRMNGPALVSLKGSASEEYAQHRRNAQKQLREETVQRKYHSHLELLASGDAAVHASMNSIDKWMKFAAPGMSINPLGFPIRPKKDGTSFSEMETEAMTQLRSLDERGFLVVPSDQFKWETHDVDFAAIAKTMDNLQEAGWPPVFIYLFDQPWKICYRFFDLMGPLLADNEAVLEASMYAWALEKQVNSFPLV
jgi:hypothetical protein